MIGALWGEPRIARVVVDDPGAVLKRTEEDLQAPDAFAVDGDQVVWADQVRSELVVFRNGKRTGAVPWPDGLYISDMRVRGDVWYLLSDDNRIGVYQFSKGAKELEMVKIVKFKPTMAATVNQDDDDDQVEVLEDDGENLFVTSAYGACMPIVGRCRAEAVVRELGEHSVVVKDGRIVAEIRMKGVYGALSRYLSHEGETAMSLIVTMGKNLGSARHRFVYLFDSSGRFVHSYTLPMTKEGSPKRDIAVSGGRVYQMISTHKSARVVELAPNP